MRNFRNMNIWKNGLKIVEGIYKLAESLPNNENWGLRSQITRASVSIPSNIAEGSSRSSNKEFKRFLEIALGSTYELETQMIIIGKLDYTDKTIIKELYKIIIDEQKMINAYKSKLES